MGRTEESQPLRVVLADDEDAVREVLRLSLDLEDDFTVVGEAADGETAVRLAGEEHPDIVILDLRMPGMDGLAALPEIRECAPGTRVVVLSAMPEAEMGDHAVAQGADGYLEKGRAMSDLPSWLRTLRLGWQAAGRVRGPQVD